MSQPTQAEVISPTAGVAPSIKYTKDNTHYYLKMGGDNAWRHNNWLGIKDSSTDTDLTGGCLTSITNPDSYKFWGTADKVVFGGMAEQSNNLSNWTFSHFTDNGFLVDFTLKDILDDLQLESNNIIDENKFLILAKNAIDNQDLTLTDKAIPENAVWQFARYCDPTNAGKPTNNNLFNLILQSTNSESGHQTYWDSGAGCLQRSLGMNMSINDSNEPVLTLSSDWFDDDSDLVNIVIILSVIGLGAAISLYGIEILAALQLLRYANTIGLVICGLAGGIYAQNRLTSPAVSNILQEGEVTLSGAGSAPTADLIENVTDTLPTLNAYAKVSTTLTNPIPSNFGVPAVVNFTANNLEDVKLLNKSFQLGIQALPNPFVYQGAVIINVAKQNGSGLITFFGDNPSDIEFLVNKFENSIQPLTSSAYITNIAFRLTVTNNAGTSMTLPAFDTFEQGIQILGAEEGMSLKEMQDTLYLLDNYPYSQSAIHK